MSKKVIVVGAGAAGMMAAGKAAENGHDVILLEKNEKSGKKLLISGKGRCNITNIADIEELIKNTPGNGNFLYSAFYNFSNDDLIAFLNRNGLATKVERGGRVFPVSDKAADVVNTFLSYLNKNNVKILYNKTVKEAIANEGEIKGVVLKSGEKLYCDSLIIATGGASYPRTGSTGDGYSIAKKLGHSVTALKPSLVPLLTQEEWVKSLQGLSLKNVKIKMIHGKRVVYEDFGEMLFTHFGVSGPLILSSSRHILDYDYKDIKLVIDLKPALSEEKLYERIGRDFEKYSRKQFLNSLDELLPKKLIPVVVQLSGILETKQVNQITKEERKKLVQILKKLEMTIIGARPIDEAIVTAGGVRVDEVNPSTMESKLVEGLFFAGEVLDLDAYTGGFNLTIAFSTGCLAGGNV